MTDESEPPRLQKRNVKVFDSDGAVIAGFWHYGALQWDEFYRYMITFVVTTTAWTIFVKMTLLNSIACPLFHVFVIPPTPIPQPCGRILNPLKFGIVWFPSLQWIRGGYPSKITDTADEVVMGGRTKIDSVQNVITMRSDLHEAWDNYEFGVDPNNSYRITAFNNGNADVNDLYLKLDHIQDPTLRPLDELFTDRFMQAST
ncbi:hypothetical protein EDB89DRAFT_2246837 [Lactarius sanguifluus]|nr:hypothetical protein EDB89DRAFT_2246837 [Lactarius sanguifluus]